MFGAGLRDDDTERAKSVPSLRPINAGPGISTRMSTLRWEERACAIAKRIAVRHVMRPLSNEQSSRAVIDRAAGMRTPRVGPG